LDGTPAAALLRDTRFTGMDFATSSEEAPFTNRFTYPQSAASGSGQIDLPGRPVKCDQDPLDVAFGSFGIFNQVGAR
jgi:hypothetical protein